MQPSSKPFARVRTLALSGVFAGLLALGGGAQAANPAAAPNPFTPAQQAALTAMIHDYVVNHPEAVVEGLNNYQRDQEKIESQQFQQNVGKFKGDLASAGGAYGGNPNGTHTVVEFFDYNCGYCKHAVDDVTALVKQDPNLKVIFKDMPILASTSQDAARWALAAGKQGKYYDFHVALMHSTAAREKATYRKIGTDIGANVDQMEKDAEGDQAIRATIEKNLQLSRDLGIHGTPAFIIGNQMYPGYMGLDSMKKALADAGTAKPGDANTAAPATTVQ